MKYTVIIGTEFSRVAGSREATTTAEAIIAELREVTAPGARLADLEFADLSIQARPVAMHLQGRKAEKRKGAA